MRRATLSEIHEEAWFPTKLRDDVTGTLQFIFNFLRLYRPIEARLGAAIRASGSDRAVDLCSGAGGPWLWLRGALLKNGCEGLRVVLTDRYPNLQAFRRAQESSAGGISGCEHSVDAQHVPATLGGFRTIFSSLHHFSPDEVVAMLEDAARRGEGIGFFELAKRRPRTIFYACFMPVATLFAVPFVRPFRLARLLWTYILPVIPFVLLWDGVLSCLRAYTPDELREMASRAGAASYTWDIGEAGAVTYVIACAAADRADSGLSSSNFRRIRVRLLVL